MKTIHYSTKAKKDLKKYRNNIRLMEALYEVLSSLVKGEAVQEKYKPHELTGNYKGCMECHVGNDFLLIWIDTIYIHFHILLKMNIILNFLNKQSR